MWQLKSLPIIISSVKKRQKRIADALVIISKPRRQGITRIEIGIREHFKIITLLQNRCLFLLDELTFGFTFCILRRVRKREKFLIGAKKRKIKSATRI